MRVTRRISRSCFAQVPIHRGRRRTARSWPRTGAAAPCICGPGRCRAGAGGGDPLLDVRDVHVDGLHRVEDLLRQLLLLAQLSIVVVRVAAGCDRDRGPRRRRSSGGGVSAAAGSCRTPAGSSSFGRRPARPPRSRTEVAFGVIVEQCSPRRALRDRPACRRRPDGQRSTSNVEHRAVDTERRGHAVVELDDLDALAVDEDPVAALQIAQRPAPSASSTTACRRLTCTSWMLTSQS